MNEQTNVLEILTGMQGRKARTASVKIKSLSEEAGKEVVFELRSLPYSRLMELTDLSDSHQSTIQVILAGVVQPDLRNATLMAKYQSVTPADMVDAMLLPGEITALYNRIMKLCGYPAADPIEDIKKNRHRPRGAVDVLPVCGAQPVAWGLPAAASRGTSSTAGVFSKGHGTAQKSSGAPVTVRPRVDYMYPSKRRKCSDSRLQRPARTMDTTRTIKNHLHLL